MSVPRAEHCWCAGEGVWQIQWQFSCVCWKRVHQHSVYEKTDQEMDLKEVQGNQKIDQVK
jgi:hypothetical protein